MVNIFKLNSNVTQFSSVIPVHWLFKACFAPCLERFLVLKLKNSNNQWILSCTIFPGKVCCIEMFSKIFFFSSIEKNFQFFRESEMFRRVIYRELSHFPQVSLVFWAVSLSPKILKKSFFLFEQKKQFSREKHLNFWSMNIATKVLNFCQQGQNKNQITGRRHLSPIFSHLFKNICVWTLETNFLQFIIQKIRFTCEPHRLQVGRKEKISDPISPSNPFLSIQLRISLSMLAFFKAAIVPSKF